MGAIHRFAHRVCPSIKLHERERIRISMQSGTDPMTETPYERAVVVRISGRVQGVWFRAWTAEQAARHRLNGWVRNRRDGTVEAMFAGKSDDVAAMIDQCRQGPVMARVADVQTAEETSPVVMNGFRQRSTV